MKLNKLHFLCVLALSLLVNFSVRATAAPSVRVGGWSLRANGQVAQDFKYTGSCPVDLKFGWGLVATAPTTVKYTFVRSDGGHQSSSMTVNIPAANQSVPIYYDWNLGANTAQFQNFSGWVELQIESPNQVTQKVPMEIHCAAAAAKPAPVPSVRVGGWSLRANGQVAQDFKYTGSCPVDLKFGWGVVANISTPLKYTFVRSDGGHQTTTTTANISAANQSLPVYYDWKLGANTAQFQNFSGWVELQIQSPNSTAQKIPFTLHCAGKPEKPAPGRTPLSRNFSN